METAFCLASCRRDGDITNLAVSSNNVIVASASNDFSIRIVSISLSITIFMCSLWSHMASDSYLEILFREHYTSLQYNAREQQEQMIEVVNPLSQLHNLLLRDTDSAARVSKVLLSIVIRRCLTYNEVERPDVLTIVQDPYL
ncbi:hypothetical protein Leryth_025052, partial [Lithospermum erythrorhizon]